VSVFAESGREEEEEEEEEKRQLLEVIINTPSCSHKKQIWGFRTVWNQLLAVLDGFSRFLAKCFSKPFFSRHVVETEAFRKFKVPPAAPPPPPPVAQAHHEITIVSLCSFVLQ
jgi:hypothetical protein